MDISAVLPVMGADQSSSSSLNDEFSATTPNGDKVFTKAIADKTIFSTPAGGQVTIAFIFDPDEIFDSNDTIASISTDYMTDLREAFSTYALKPEDIAPKTKSLEETVWDQITSLLPKETLSKNVFSKPEQLEDYMQLIKTVTTANYNEEEKLTEFMKTAAFSFSFRIALDSYPDDNSQQKQKKRKDKCGVLTFHLEGTLKAAPSKETATATTPAEGSGEKNSKKRKLEDGEEANGSNSSSSVKKESDPKKPKKEKEIPHRQKVLQELNLDEAFKAAAVVRCKDFPLSATLFFEAIGRWFSSCVSTKHGKLEKQKNKNPLYQ